MSAQLRNLSDLANRKQANMTSVKKDEYETSFLKNDTQLINDYRKATAFGDESALRNKTEALLIMQKAQIQRLTESMNDYKCKLKHQNIENLDRKSYELQIGQLFENNNKNKFEIEKLNTSIKSLVSSNQKYRKQLSLANHKVFQLQSNKRQLVQQLEILKFQHNIVTQDFQSYKKEAEQNLQKAHKQILLHRTFEDTLKSSNQDLLKRVNCIPNYQSKLFQLENALSHYRDQNELMKAEIARCKEKIIIVEKNHATLYDKNSLIQKENSELKQINEQAQSKLISLQSQVAKDSQFEKMEALASTKQNKKITLLSDKIKNLNLRNQKTLTTCKALTDINNKMKEEKRVQEVQLSNLKIVLADYDKKLADSLNKHSIFLHQSNKYQAQLSKRLAERESKINALVAQNQKLTKQAARCSKLISNKVAESEYLKRKLIEVEADLREQFQNNFHQQKKSHGTQIAGLQKKISQRYMQSSQNNALSKSIQLNRQQSEQKVRQISSLKDQIKSKSQQIQHLKSERQQIAILLGHKISQNQSLKKKFFTLQQQFKEQLQLTVNNLKSQHQKKLSEQISSNKAVYSKLQSQFVSIQLLTGQFKQERDLLIKKNASLIKGIQHLSNEIKILHEGAQKISSFFSKDSVVHQNLEKHYLIVQDIFNQIERLQSTEDYHHRLQTVSNF